MITALESMSGAGLLALFGLALVLGFGASRGWDRFVCWAQDARVRARGRAQRGWRRLLVVLLYIGAAGGLLVIMSAAYAATH